MEDERGDASGRGGGGLCQSTQKGGNSGCLQMFASALTDNVEQRSSLLSPFSLSLKSLHQIFSSVSGSKSRSFVLLTRPFFFFGLFFFSNMRQVFLAFLAKV